MRRYAMFNAPRAAIYTRRVTVWGIVNCILNQFDTFQQSARASVFLFLSGRLFVLQKGYCILFRMMYDNNNNNNKSTYIAPDQSRLLSGALLHNMDIYIVYLSIYWGTISLNVTRNKDGSLDTHVIVVALSGDQKLRGSYNSSKLLMVML